MNLELNLVKTQTIHSHVFILIARKRVLISDENSALKAIINFILENIINLENVITNKELIDKLRDLKELSINEFYSLKYVLASEGIDIFTNIVAEKELNESNIPEDILEYNIVDNSNSPLKFIRVATKIPLNTTEYFAELYKRAVNTYKLLEGDLFGRYLFDGYRNPFKYHTDYLREIESSGGTVYKGVLSFSLVVDLTSKLEQLEKDIYVIMS